MIRNLTRNLEVQPLTDSNVGKDEKTREVKEDCGLTKLRTWDRFPSPAPMSYRSGRSFRVLQLTPDLSTRFRSRSRLRPSLRNSTSFHSRHWNRCMSSQ